MIKKALERNALKEYAVVDLETTGGAGGGRVTEIAVFVTDGQTCIEQWTTLVNPGISVPSNITYLTGITDDMLQDAPAFEEVAHQLRDMLNNRVFVAHSVAFDYGVLKTEYARLNISFNFARLCTVRLSRKIIPGMHSYSLGKLTQALGIQLTDRHRAYGDAEATMKLFHLLLANGSEVIEDQLKRNRREFTLPPTLQREPLMELPEKPGVYFFRDSEGKVIYVGKAKNLSQRVWNHFREYSPGKHRMKDRIAYVDFQLSGSELLAELMESVAIRKYFPEFNKAQKYDGNPYGWCLYNDQKGRLRIEVARRKKYLELMGIFPNRLSAIQELEGLAQNHALCRHLLGLSKQIPCRPDDCPWCADDATADLHNSLLRQALEQRQSSFYSGIYALPGRNEDEKAFLLIQAGVYRGYGFVPKDHSIQSEQELWPFLNEEPHNIETWRILKKVGLQTAMPT